MWIKDNTHITVNKSKEVWSDITGTWKKIEDEEIRKICINLYKLYRKRTLTMAYKNAAYDNAIEQIKSLVNGSCQTVDTTTSMTMTDEEILESTLSSLINFFSEFSFEPNYRFVNTLSYAIQNDTCKSYVANYFELTDNGYKQAVMEKMNSHEFNNLIKDLKTYKPTHKINNRFALYYGSQGTGKTTQAILEADNNVMVCHSAMLPSDLMEDFKFEDGKANFIPSALQIAMVEGKKIVLDEINLLPFESLRFLQSILDGKKQFVYKGKTIEIKDGFKIIGTMNLVVNGATYALPEPLVDRCEDIKKYSLTAKSLMGAIL